MPTQIRTRDRDRHVNCVVSDTPEEVTKKLNTQEEWVRFTRLDGKEIVVQRESVVGATEVSGSAE